MRAVLCSVIFCVFSLYTVYCCTEDDILSAVRYGNLETLKNCPESHNLNNTALYWEDALSLAAQNCYLDIIRFLVEEKHVDIDSHKPNLPTAIQVAVGNEWLECVKLLVQLGANVNLGASDRIPYAILRAVEQNNTDIVKFLLENGADPFVTTQSQDTILHRAVANRNLDMIKEMIRFKELINAKNAEGIIPIDQITRCSYQLAYYCNDVMKILVEEGSNVTDQLFWNFVYYNDDNNARKFLVEKSGKVDIRDIWDNSDCRDTLLMKMLSEEISQYDMIKFLIDQGANVTIVYCNNETALHRAASLGRENVTQVIQMLLDHGADINAINSDGFTPLDKAAINGHKEVVEYLSKLGGVHTQSYEDKSKANSKAQR